MSYKPVHLNDAISVDELYTIHYFEYMNDFHFTGETHDFWEFCFADKGEVRITMDTSELILKKGDVAFHKPNEFHSVSATGSSAPNLAVVSFGSQSAAMDFFCGKVLHTDETERTLLANIIIEAKQCFSHRLDDPYQTGMSLDEHVPWGTEQLIRLYLEQFLIHIQRRYLSGARTGGVLPKATKSRSDNEVFSRVTAYLEQNLTAHVTIEQICRDNLIGRSQLQKIFRERSGLGIIDYFSRMKIDTAKEMIRMNHMNFTQISEKLGYTSIHYFSRQFKKITGTTPSDYASSIRALASGNFDE